MIALSLLVLLSVLLLPLEAFSAVPSTRRSFLAISSIGMSSSQQVDNELRFWNREEGTAQALRPSSPIRKQAKIVVVSDPVDPDLTPLSAPLPDGSEILQTENRLNEVDFDLLREQECNVAVASYGPDTRAIITELVQNVPSLEWIHLRSAGIDFCTSPELAQWKGTVTNAKGQFSSTLAEYSMMACSFFAKDLPLLMKNKKAKNWDRYAILELRGASFGVVGFGDIGRACAKLAKAYGMKVTALRRRPKPNPLCDQVYGNDKESLNRIFGENDYILCAAPLTPETNKMIGKEQFENAKPGAVFINVGRGPIVDEQALIEALKSGKLKGAALDVFETEPLPKDSPLWEMDNVLLSPHNMDKTETFMREATEFFVNENLPRFVRGQPLLNPVDPAAGY